MPTDYLKLLDGVGGSSSGIPVASSASNAKHQLYQQQRHVYGPYTILGTSLLAGGITTLRRGRMSGILSTVVVGGLSYGIIYGLHDMDDNETSPAVDFAKLLPQRITDLWKSK